MTSATNSFLQVIQRRVRAEINLRNLLPEGSRTLIAVSGGQDSLALSEILRRYAYGSYSPWPWGHKSFETAGERRIAAAGKDSGACNPRNILLGVAHADHRWPGDVGCVDHVAAYAHCAGLPFHVADPAPGPVPRSEAGARAWRYEVLADIAEQHGYTHVAVGHTQSDLAETLLFNLTHGAGADGLSSLTWKRALTPTISLVRPMLSISRLETAGVCQELNMAIWNDVYNRDPRYARCRTREYVLPYLREHYNPRVEDALARTSHLLRDESSALEQMAAEVYKRAVHINDKGGLWIRIDRGVMADEHVAIQRRVFRRVLVKEMGAHMKTAIFKQVEGLLNLLSSPSGKSVASLPLNGSAFVDGDALVLHQPVSENQGESRVRVCPSNVTPVRQRVLLSGTRSENVGANVEASSPFVPPMSCRNVHGLRKCDEGPANGVMRPWKYV